MEDKHDKYQEYYEVEAILDKRKFGAKWKYLIKWVGWSVNQCTWEPIENLNCSELVEDFESCWKGEQSKEIKKRAEERNDKINKKDDDLTCSDSQTDDVKLNNFIKGDKQSFIKKRGRPKKYTSMHKDNEDISYQTLPLTHQKPYYTNYPSNHINLIRDHIQNDLLEKYKDINNKSNEFFRYLEGNIKIDTPMQIKTCKRVGDKVNLLVEWKERDDGIKPEDSYVLNSDLRKKFHDLLLDYYESKITFPGEKKYAI